MKQALADALAQQGYDTLTPVQKAVTDPDLGAADLLVSAQTGSGKTVGFGLAIAPTLLGEAEQFDAAAAPLALVIAPTRELAMQVKRELAWLYAKAGVSVASCVGGMDMRDERRALDRGAHIVVATPGRLRDHIMRNSIKMDSLRAIVLDEADEMLDLGFQEDLEFILGKSPESRRTLMFSATVPRGIANLAGKYQKDAVRIATTSEREQHADIEYRAMGVAARDAENAIINVLRYYEAPNALVFANTRAMVNRLTTRLSNRGFQVVALSGELSQAERTHALQAMRDGRARVCVATDVAARGIDLPNLDLVVHAELPTSHETLLHRSGRTGRAGRKGVSAMIIPPAARKKCERILKGAKLTAQWVEAPSADEVTARDHERMLADPLWELPVGEAERAMIDTLMERFSPEQLAAAYLHLFQSRQSAPEDLSPPGTSSKPEPRAPFGPSVWFSVAGGRQAQAEPRRLLPMLCKAGNLTKDDIGAIRVQYNVSFVELRAASVPQFLAALGDAMTVEGGAQVTQLATPPEFSARARPDPSPTPRAPRTGTPKPAPIEAKPDSAADAPFAPAQSDDVSKPRAKKPKAQAAEKPAWTSDSRPPRESDAKPPRASPAKPRPKPARAARPEDTRPEGVVEPYKKRAPAGTKPTGKPSGKAYGKSTGKPGGKSSGKPSGKPAGKPVFAKPAAPKAKKSLAQMAGAPPVGKPGSKKNRARAKLIAQQRTNAGAAPPKRRDPS